MCYQCEQACPNIQTNLLHVELVWARTPRAYSTWSICEHVSCNAQYDDWIALYPSAALLNITTIAPVKFKYAFTSPTHILEGKGRFRFVNLVCYAFWQAMYDRSIS